MLEKLRRISWLKPIRNAGTLSLGRMAQGVFSVIYTALAARGLGLEDFGALVLIHAFALAVSQLARFQSWQVLLRYGAQALHAGDHSFLQRVVKFSVLLDCISVLIAFFIMLFISEPAARLFGLPPDNVALAQLYGFCVVFINSNATPTGMLRLLDRFDLLSIQTAIEPAFRLLGVIILYLSSAGLHGYLLVWLLAIILGKVLLNFLAWRAFRQRGLLSGFTSSSKDIFTLAPGAWRFAWGTNLSSSLGLVSTQLPTLAVGSFFGPSGAGLFKIAQQLANSVTKVNSKLLVPAIYGDLVHLIAAQKWMEARIMVTRTALLVGVAAFAIFIILFFLGKPVITFLAGPEFVGAYPVMLLLALAGIFDALGVPLEPLLVSAGKIGLTTIIRFVSALIYAFCLLFLMPLYGLNGAGLATIIYDIATGLLFGGAAYHYLVRRK